MYRPDDRDPTPTPDSELRIYARRGLRPSATAAVLAGDPDDIDTTPGLPPGRRPALRITRELPTVPEPALPEPPPRPSSPPAAAPDVERAIVRCLLEPADPSEPLEAAFARREAAICEIVARLDPADAAALHRRLTLAQPGDGIVFAMERLNPARRRRIASFLAAAPRRAALAEARAPWPPKPRTDE